MRVVALCGVNQKTSNGTLVEVGRHQVRAKTQGDMRGLEREMVWLFRTCSGYLRKAPGKTPLRDLPTCRHLMGRN